MALKHENFSDSASSIELLERAKNEFNREKRLVIKNLPFNTTEKDIQSFMGFNGEFPVEEITMVKYFNQAVVTLKDPALVPEAISKLDNTKLDTLTVSVSVYRSDKMLCVSHLPPDTTEYKFREMVSEFGNVEKCFLMRSENTGESKGYGLVEYNEPIEKVGQIKVKLDWLEVGGHTLHCDAITDSAQSGLTFADLHSKCLLVDKLPLDFKDPIELREIVSKVVKPVFCQILTKDGESLGFGVLEFDCGEDAEKVHTELNGHKINSSVIGLSYCIPGKSAIHMSNRIMFKYGTQVSINKSSLLPDPVYPNPAFLKHSFFKLHVSKNPRLLVQFTDSLVQLSEGYVKTLEDKTNAKPGLLGPAPTIPMSPLMDVNLQLGLLSLIVLDSREKGTYNGEVPDPLGKLKIPTKEECQQNQKQEPVSLLGDPLTAQANIILKNLLTQGEGGDLQAPPSVGADMPTLLGRPITALNLVYLCSLGRLMAMMSDRTHSMGLLGQAPGEMGHQVAGPKPLMENLNKMAQSLINSITSKASSQLPSPQGLLGNAPMPNMGVGPGKGSNTANLMNAIQAMAMQKMNDKKPGAGGLGMAGPSAPLEALFANKSKQPGGGLLGNFPGPMQGPLQGGLGGPKTSPNNNTPPAPLLGKGPSSLFSNKGDGLLPTPPLPSPKEGQGGFGNQGSQGSNHGGGYDDSGYQGGYDDYNSAYNEGYNDYNTRNDNNNYGNQGNQGNQSWMGNSHRDSGYDGGVKRKMSNEGRSDDKDYNNIAQQAAAYAAGAAAAYKQQYEEYMARAGYGNYGNDYQGYGGSGYDSSNTRDYGSGYRGNSYDEGSGDNYGSYGGSGGGNYGSESGFNSSANSYNSFGAGYSSNSSYSSNTGSFGGSYESTGSYGGSTGSYGGSTGNYGSGNGNYGSSSGSYMSSGGSTGGYSSSNLISSYETSKGSMGSSGFSRDSSNYSDSTPGSGRYSSTGFSKGLANSDNSNYRASALNSGPIRDVKSGPPLMPGLGMNQGKSSLMGPPLPPIGNPGILGTPQGQKRSSAHILPSPEPSPEGDYIGQHSQGLGGHYADTYAKRQKLTGKF